MHIVNETPFPFIEFESRSSRDRPFRTLVLQATYAIESDLRLMADQGMVRLENEYYGEPGRSSLTLEAALAPYKRGTDIHLNAVARTAQPAREWPVSVSVGKIHKRLRVRGSHRWQHRDGEWRRTMPERCREVPICYERAFGGSYQHEGEFVRHEENPYGTGWIHDHTPTDCEIAAPQIVADDEPQHEPGCTYPPAGFGPIGCSWEPRLARAGTFDDRWLAERNPLLPEDFSYWYYSSASTGLICPGYLWGDEQVELVNLGVPGVRRFSLPDVWLNAFLDYGDGIVVPRLLMLDTLHIDVAHSDPTRHWLLLTWRCVFPAEPEPRFLTTRLVHEEGVERCEERSHG